MTTSYGAGTSRYIDPSGRNWDTLVIQQLKPGFDGEQNLQQDLRSAQDLLRARASCPSGWLTGDFWEAEPYGPSSWLFGTTANTFGLVGRPLVTVNGWVFPVEFTGSALSGVNLIELDPPSANIGAVDADFVFLEVWRALVLADPSTANKPSATEVYPNGNILADPATYLADDLLNPIPGPSALEGAGRVQVQYALRSIRLNSRATRLGYDDAAVFAQGPAGALTPYAFSPAAGDPGLWRAGTGVPADTGTVDGYVYSIPVAIVFRRNLYQSGGLYWDYLSNGNGGAPLSAGTSDRPDGLFGDQVAAADLLDLRHAVSLGGPPDYARVGEFSWSLLQDLTLRSWALDAAFTGWTAAGDNAGNLYFKADDFIPSVPGTDLASGNTIRSVDGICTVFSDRPSAVRYLFRTAAPMGGWAGGEVLTLDFSALSPLGAPLADEMPLGTIIRDVVRVVQDDGDGSAGQLEWPPAVVTGLGTQAISITLDALPPVPGSLREVWAEVLVEYPAGGGMTSHVTEPPANFALQVHAPSNLGPAIGAVFTDDPAGRAAVRAYLQADYEAGPHRELALTYTTFAPEVLSLVSTSATVIVLPEPVLGGLAGVVSVTDSGATPHVVASVDVTGRVITLDPGDPLPAPDDLVTVTYQPVRPLPVTATPLTAYYRSAALQAINAEYLPATLEVSPVWVPSSATVMTASSGSPLTPYPYEAPSQQLPVNASSAAWAGEDNLLSPGEVSLTDFSVNAGMIQAPVMIPPVPGAAWRFNNPVNIGAQDAEFIDHYQSSPVPDYKPNTAAQGLSAIQRHKTAYPVLAILRQDTLWAREGELVLVVLTEYHPLDKINRVAMSDDVLNAAGAAAIYRVKGGWLTPVP